MNILRNPWPSEFTLPADSDPSIFNAGIQFLAVGAEIKTEAVYEVVGTDISNLVLDNRSTPSPQ
jgi:hypothetical protein